MEKFEAIGKILKSFANATELYDFYQQSDLVKISVALAEKFYNFSQTSDEYVKRHIKVDIDDYISRYKNALKEIDIEFNDFFK